MGDKIFRKVVELMKARFLPLLVSVLLLIAVFGGCSPSPLPDPEPLPTTTVGTTTAPTTAVPTAPPVNTALYNRLTGEYDNAAGKDARAVGVMIGNNPKSRPQVGIANADVFVEAETEGGITRIMAIYSDASRIPAQLCPIRSARSPFVLMAQSLDLVYVHAGGSVAGLQTLANSGVDSINALGSNGDTFWRDPTLRTQRGLEYSLSTAGNKLSARIASKGIRKTSDRAPFTFGDEAPAGETCKELQVTFSRSQTDCFVYNEQSGLYKKYVGKLGSASVHVTTDNAPIEVTNVVVLYDTKYAENNTTINFNLKSGSGIIVNGGQKRDITWERTKNGLTFTENGKPATFLPGKTYICLTATSNKGATIVR